MTDDATFYRDNGYVLVPGVFDSSEVQEMRDAIGRADGVEDHVDWGIGLMVTGSNAGFWAWRSRFRSGRRTKRLRRIYNKTS